MLRKDLMRDYVVLESSVRSEVEAEVEAEVEVLVLP